MIDQPPDDTDSAQRVSEEHERARALADVLREQEERAQAALEAEARRHRRARIRRGALLAAWAVVAYVWLGNPSWTRVQVPPTPPLVQDVSSLRLSIFLQVQQIEAFQSSRGRLPWVLQEAGPPFPGMEYHRSDNRTYELEARSDRVRLSYASERPALDFVGKAADVLAGGADAQAVFAPEAGGPPAQRVERP
jgi:hypothetical protein